LPPKIVTAPSDLFDNNKPGNSISGNNIFISPSKWDPIKNGKLPVVPQDKDCNDMIPGKITNRLKRQKEQNERAMHNLLSKSTRPRQKLCQPYVSVPMGLSSKSADWNKKESDKWCRKNNPDWCRGRQIIDTNGHVIKKANNNVAPGKNGGSCENVKKHADAQLSPLSLFYLLLHPYEIQ
jgi:hypothetical protein